MRGKIAAIAVLGALTGCSTTSGDWERTGNGSNAKFERAKQICQGKAAGNFGQTRGGLIVRAVTSDAVFKGCMAEQGYVGKPSSQ